MSTFENNELAFRHVVLEGSAYEVGRAQGDMIKLTPGYAGFLTSRPQGKEHITPQQIHSALQLFDRYCPGLNEEIQGFADSLGVPVEQVAYYAITYNSKGSCGHMAVLPEATDSGHLYVGRSYEWSLEDEMRLCTTRVKGHAAHIGFSIFQFGRFDGINEHGLCATMSAGVPMSMPQEEGCLFWAVIRTILDRCKNIEEGLEVVRCIPMNFNWNLILADKSGNAALVEIACNKHEVYRIRAYSDKKFVLATNHYTQPGMIPFDAGRMWQSVARYKAMESRLNAAVPAVSKETIRGILTDKVPEGICCHYYADGLGTLWSMIFDVTAGQVDVCFGSPQANRWHSFGLKDPAGAAEYKAVFPMEQVADPAAFYRRLEPGAGID
jgi:predicted choloylglycine hydrolase